MTSRTYIGECKWLVGMAVERRWDNGAIKYIHDTLSRFDIVNCKTVAPVPNIGNVLRISEP